VLDTAAASPARDRLLVAAAQLLEQSGDRTASTRAICERAGVTAPTLYHHFGNKQGLIEAVINHGFTQYVNDDGVGDEHDDPIDHIRRGWEAHVRFGLEQPSFYALLYGRVRPGIPCAITGPAEARLTDLAHAAAQQGLLRVPVRQAAAQILAANVGVTLSLIAQPANERDPRLSDQVREAILAAVTVAGPRRPDQSRTTAAIALRVALESDSSRLSAGEATLLGELLDRLAGD
jgi:AcrR family transcriptional regulator